MWNFCQRAVEQYKENNMIKQKPQEVLKRKQKKSKKKHGKDRQTAHTENAGLKRACVQASGTCTTLLLILTAKRYLNRADLLKGHIRCQKAMLFQFPKQKAMFKHDIPVYVLNAYGILGLGHKEIT